MEIAVVGPKKTPGLRLVRAPRRRAAGRPTRDDAALIHARILDAAGAEVGQAFIFVGNQPLAGTPAGNRIVDEFLTPPAAVSTEGFTSGQFVGTLFTLQSGTNGWVAALGNSVTLVFGVGDQVQPLVDGFVAANSGRSLPGLA